ncbi:TPA: hypothetical protein QCO88_004212 [Bacillus cereus]|uniref:hypothetical protein n=1 Tax=Bacillus sp. FSL M8-0139 TaxID=2921613 RepID=UPI0030F54593|nr:hypothetical protein [Bacillus cereus]
MAFINIKNLCDSYLNARIKSINGTSPGSVIYSPDYVFEDKIKGIQSNPTISAPATVDYETGSYPIINNDDSKSNRTIKISDPRPTSVTLTTKSGFSTGASVEQSIELSLSLGGTISGGILAGGKYNVKIQTTAKTELSYEHATTTSIKTGVQNQDYVVTLPPHYDGHYKIQYYKTEPIYTPTGWTSVIQGDRSQYGINIPQGGATGGTPRQYSYVLAHKTFKNDKGQTMTMIMTADELALSIPGYSKPSNITGDKSKHTLSTNIIEDIQIKDQATFGVVFDPPLTRISGAEDSSKFIDVYYPSEDSNLKYYQSIKVALDFDINEDSINFNNHDNIGIFNFVTRNFLLNNEND